MDIWYYDYDWFPRNDNRSTQFLLCFNMSFAILFSPISIHKWHSVIHFESNNFHITNITSFINLADYLWHYTLYKWFCLGLIFWSIVEGSDSYFCIWSEWRSKVGRWSWEEVGWNWDWFRCRFLESDTHLGELGNVDAHVARQLILDSY